MALVAPHLTLLREAFNALHYPVRYGVAWRAMPNGLPPGRDGYAVLPAGGQLAR